MSDSKEAPDIHVDTGDNELESPVHEGDRLIIYGEVKAADDGTVEVRAKKILREVRGS